MLHTRRVFAAGALAAASTPALAAGPRSDLVEFPFNLARGLPMVSCESGGAALPFVLAINANYFGAHPSVIQLWNTRQGAGRGDPNQYTREVLIGGALRLPSHLLRASPRRFEETGAAGLFGLAYYRNYAIDWDRKRVTVGRLDGRGRPGFEEIPTRRLGTSLPIVEAELDGRKLTLHMVSTISGGVALSASAVRRLDLWDAYERRRDEYDHLTGRNTHRVVVGRSLKIGALEVRRPLVTLLREHGNAVDGFIGVDMLRRLNIVSTRPSLRMWVAPSGQADDVQADDRAGLSLVRRSGGYVAAGLDAAGPAHAAGLRDGDLIVGHEGEGGLDGLAYALTRAAGTEVGILVARDDGAPRPMRIVLAERV
ncbi:MAG TPA: hypothetical protein VGB49_08355 [Caulobacteraceae bacterium]